MTAPNVTSVNQIKWMIPVPKLQKCSTWYCSINYSYNGHSRNVFIYSFINHFELYCENSMIGKGGICVDIFIIKRKKTFHKTGCQVANCHLWENVLWNIGHVYHGEGLTSLKGWIDCFELYSGWWKSWSLFLESETDLAMTARSGSWFPPYLIRGFNCSSGTSHHPWLKWNRICYLLTSPYLCNNWGLCLLQLWNHLWEIAKSS